MVAVNKYALQGFVGASLVFGALLLVVGCSSTGATALPAPLHFEFAPVEPVRYSITIRNEAPVSVTLNNSGEALVNSLEEVAGESAVVVHLSAMDSTAETLSLTTDSLVLGTRDFTNGKERITVPEKRRVTLTSLIKFGRAPRLEFQDQSGTDFVSISRLN